ncbi:MAG: 5,10-methylenetetrahydrofolate reductase, partial [Lachnospiraceae bacterium]|nr:5,10-methylenetetrahydrofolate reductase [Lachnospiraceae bacterium]
REEGIEYTVNQILEYVSLGVGGIHLYALNTWENSTEILNKAGIRTIV